MAARGRTARYAQAMTRSTRAWLRRASRRPALPGAAAPRGPLATLAAVAVIALIVASCASAAIPVVSFDPASACTTDGRQPGAYPDLEALLPTAYRGKAPDNVDSGRNCTPESLGTLAEAGIDGVRFAGATWGLGGTSALTVAVFEADGLTPDEMLDFYAQSAGEDRHTDKLSTADVTVGDAAGRRLDVLGTNGTGHTVVAWPAEHANTVVVLLASDLGDTAVLEALDEFAGT
jgi:hypothetical protein